MCLIVFSYKQHPDYDLIVAANRDEFYERPAREARFWEEHPELLAGKDLKEGGTWMGITTGGRLSALTNYRDMENHDEQAPSRGELVLDYLVGSTPPEQYLQSLHPRSHHYNGFNLITGTPDKLLYYSNHNGMTEQLGSGIYGLSNALISSSWPKTERAKSGLERLIRNDRVSSENLFALLADDRPAPEEELPDTGLPTELEKAVSPIFIKTDRYGTRCSTVLKIRRDGQVTFEERRYKEGSREVTGSNTYDFSLDR